MQPHGLCSPLGSSVCGISQARILEWVAFLSPGDLPYPAIEPTSALVGGYFSAEPTVGELCLFLLNSKKGFFILKEITFLMMFWLSKHGVTYYLWTSLEHLPTMWETQVRSLGQEDPLEKEMSTHSSILAWRIPWTEEPGRLTVHGVTKSRT